MLLTRSPLTHPSKNQDRPVRLACVKHAASVRPEPGSNSPKKPKTKQTSHKPPPHTPQQPSQDTRTSNPQPEKQKQTRKQEQPTHNATRPHTTTTTNNRSSNHTRPHNATDRPWHKKQAHYRDLKQHTHKTRPAGTFTDHSRSRHRIRLSRSASAGQAPGPATLVTRPRKDFAADRSAVPVSLLR